MADEKYMYRMDEKSDSEEWGDEDEIPQENINVLKHEANPISSYDKISHPFTYDVVSSFYDEHGNPVAKKNPIQAVGYLCGFLLKDKSFVPLLSDNCPNPNDLPKKVPQKEAELTCHNYGLKFHISLPENKRDEYERGWNIACGTLIKHGVNCFKIFNPKKNFSDIDPEERGKDITVYTIYNPEKTLEDWQKILTEVTQELVNAKVSPGYRPPGKRDREAPVNGSNYISYRYDQELGGTMRYYEQYKGWPEKDYFSNVIVDIKNQPEMPEYKSEKSISNILSNKT